METRPSAAALAAARAVQPAANPAAAAAAPVEHLDPAAVAEPEVAVAPAAVQAVERPGARALAVLAREAARPAVPVAQARLGLAALANRRRFS